MANTLLVVGNGFDKACGLPSSFNDYIKSDFYKDIWSSCKFMADYIINEGTQHGRCPKTIEILGKSFSEVSFWDLYFDLPYILNYSEKELSLWSDFETKLSQLIAKIEKNSNEWNDEVKNASWTDLQREKYSKSVVRAILLKEYLEFKLGTSLDKVDKSALAAFLYLDLKKYEENFGKYIHTIQTSCVDYSERANGLIQQLIGSDKDDKLAYLNTFNYSDLSGNILVRNAGIWHINGDWKTPIIGMDRADSYISNPWYKFTKTYRRLEINGSNLCYPLTKNYTRVVVYGHSLNKQDDNFFFALFNRLNLSNDRGRKDGYYIEFAYNAYPGKDIEEAKRERIEGVIRMLKTYNEEILQAPNFRLMDILYCNNVVRFRPISLP